MRDPQSPQPAQPVVRYTSREEHHLLKRKHRVKIYWLIIFNHLKDVILTFMFLVVKISIECLRGLSATKI